jgi:serine/threonine protein kinase
MEKLVGRTLNRYTIESLIGEGGIGAVYRARDTLLEREVAIKVMRPEFAERETFQKRFLQEARTAARLDQPSIVKVHDFGEEDELLYIVMEYIPGDNLRGMLQNLRAQNKWIILTEAVQIVQQVCKALDYIHNQGVMHRDIKPDNLMLKPEPGNGLPYRVVITDLGLARIIAEEEELEDGISMGTPGYMSPEQATGQDAGPSSEVYSLGVLLYELAVGRLPFPARTISEVVRYHQEEPVPEPRTIRPDLPLALEKVIMRALAKNPEARFSGPGEMSVALEQAMPTVHEAAYTPESIEDTVSLVTQYDVSEAETQASPVASSRPAGPNVANRQDFIQVLLPDRSVRMMQITGDEMTIGREAENDLVLDHPRISRQHARLQFDGQHYWISDLNSRNGTFLADQRLDPGEPQVWGPNQAIKIGDVWLRLKRGWQPGTIASGEMVPAETVAEVALSHPAASNDRIEVFMETVHLSVTPGSSTTARLIILNKGPARDQFRISLEGVPTGWVTPPPVIQLPPGGQQEVRINIQPPQSPNSRPGRYPVTFHVQSQSEPDQRAGVKAILTVGVYPRFTSELSPRRLHADQAAQVTIQNQGNAQDTFVVEMIDQSEELVFHPDRTRLTLQEGEVATAEFMVAPRRRRIVGGARTDPFSARITASSGETRSHSAEMTNMGIIPPIVVPVLLVLCLCLSALAAYGYIDLLRGPVVAQQTAAAETQIAAATQAALAQANQATIQAATATTEWLLIQTLTAQPTPFTPFPTETPTPTETFTPVVIIVTPTEEPTIPTPTETNTPIIIIVTPTQPEPTPVTPSPTTPALEPTPTPLGGSFLIEFSSNRDGQYEIYGMLSTGAQQTRVTNHPANDTQPSLSPEKSRLVFTSDRDGVRQIYRMNADGSGLGRISNNNFDEYSPAWSPDGGRVAFVSTRDGNPEIYVMNIDGGAQQRLTNNTDSDDNPAWSPDGGRIAFDSGDDNNRAIYVMNADGSGLAPLTENNTFNSAPAWSPDGSRIAFVSNRDGNLDLYLINADGANVVRLTNLAEGADNPVWSPDGHWIAFNTRTPNLAQIYSVRPDGSGLTNLTNTQADNIDPTW